MVETDMNVGHLSLHSVGKTYGGTEVLSDVSIEVARGSFVVLLGPSGCGKSTLLRILAGLLPSDNGRVVLDGRDITRLPAWDRDIGLVFQNYALFPNMSVARNVAFGLEMRRLDRDAVARRVAESLDLVRMGHLASRNPTELSGGQQQRVAIARAIAIQPRLLLLDEPLSSLDAVLRASVREELRELHDRTGITTIMVTHDQAEALSIADRVVLMSEGRVMQHDTPEVIYRAPATAFVASFVGSPAAALFRVEPGVWPVDFAPPPALAARLGAVRVPVLMALRPEDLTLAPSGTGYALPARLRRVEFLGADRMAHVEAGGQQLVVRLREGQAVSDPEVAVVLPPEPPLFDADTGALISQPIQGDRHAV